MIEFLYIPIILILYLRTWNYRYLIDCPVPRDGYMYVITEGKETTKWRGLTINRGKEFYEQRKPLHQTVVNIGTFIGVCGYIHYLWGWQPALLYAVFPLNVSSVAWGRTGSYYSATVLLILASFTFVKYGLWGNIVSALFFTAALNSTLSSIPFLVIALLYPYGWIQTWPLIAFFLGKRWKAGWSQRLSTHEKRNVQAGQFHIRNLIRCYKVIAYYIYLTVWPKRLGFFHEEGRQSDYLTVKKTIMACFLVTLWLYFTVKIDPLMALWWIVFIGIYSQFTTMGQYITERYTFLSNVAFCVILAKVLAPYPILFTIVSTLYFCRSLQYIPAWKDNQTLFSYSMTQFPKAPENYNNLASHYLDYKQFYSALKPLLLAYRYTEGLKYNIIANLASTYGQLGEFQKALNYTIEARIQKDCPKDQIEALSVQEQNIRLRLQRVNENKRVLKKMKILD